MDQLPSSVADAVFPEHKLSDSASTKSSSIQEFSSTIVDGYDFNKGINYHALLQSFKTTGFQATNFGMAVDQINQMVVLI